MQTLFPSGLCLWNDSDTNLCQQCQLCQFHPCGLCAEDVLGGTTKHHLTSTRRLCFGPSILWCFRCFPLTGNNKRLSWNNTNRHTEMTFHHLIFEREIWMAESLPFFEGDVQALSDALHQIPTLCLAFFFIKLSWQTLLWLYVMSVESK